MSDLNRQPPIAGVQLGVRIAIDSGIVVVGQLGETAGGADDILGEAPNTAARLQQLADPNTVLVTETVRQLVEWQFHFAQHGEVELKGFSAPVRVYRVTAERHNSRHGRPIRSERIYDREIEQGTLDRCWRDIVAGRGQTILISGEPGIGKTALVDYLRRTVTASGGMCVHTSCFPEGIHAPLLPIRDLLRQAIGIALLDDLSTLRTKLDAIATRDGLDCEFVKQILLPLLDPGSSEMTFTGLAASERKRRSDFVVNWLRSIADRSPFLVIVEDVHWADTTSLEFLDLLMAQVAGTRLCLALTWRTGFQRAWIDRANVTRIPVTRLKDETIDAVVSGMVGHDAADVALRQAIAAKAEGNPLFAEELALLANQTRTENRSVDVLTLPSSLNDSLLARLDDLGELKRIAQVAAVIGREFDDMVLARVLGIPRGVLAPMLESLIASGIVVDFRGGLGTSHGFKHALVRDAASNSLLKARRRAIHAKTAATLAVEFPRVAEANPELVAQHYEEAALFGEAITWWTKAGDQASRHSTTVDSIRLLERARALFARLRGEDQPVREAEVLNLLGVQYIAALGYASPLVEQAFGEAVEILGDGRDEAPGTLFFALWGLHIHAMVRGDVPRAVENGIRMLGLAEAEGDSDKILQAHRLQGLARLLMGGHGEATHHYLEVLKGYDPILHQSHRFRYGSDPAVLALAYRQIPDPQEEPARPRAGQAQGSQGRIATADAWADPRTRRMAQAGGQRLLQLPRGADQRPYLGGLPLPRHRSLAAYAAAARPETPDDLAADRDARRPVAPQTPDPPPLAQPTLCRQTPKVGAVCGKAARTVLCGGRAVMRVPTAIEANVLPFWLSVQPTGRDGDFLACKDIGRENYRMLSLTLIFRNFHWRHGERIYRRKSPQLSIEAIARYRDQHFESGLLRRRVCCEPVVMSIRANATVCSRGSSKGRGISSSMRGCRSSEPRITAWT